MNAGFTYRLSFVLAAIDLWVAVVLASCGDVRFVAFMVLSGAMYAQGLYFKSKMEKKGEYNGLRYKR